MDLSYNGRLVLKFKFKGIPGIYLWVNKNNNRSYIGKSVNLFIRISKYFSTNYIRTNKNKMAICGAIDKYGINSFNLYIIEKLDFADWFFYFRSKIILISKKRISDTIKFSLPIIFRKFYNHLLDLIIIDMEQNFQKVLN